MCTERGVLILHLLHGDELLEDIGVIIHIVSIDHNVTARGCHGGDLSHEHAVISLYLRTCQHITCLRLKCLGYIAGEGQHVSAQYLIIGIRLEIIHQSLILHETHTLGKLYLRLHEADRVNSRQHDAISGVVGHNLLTHVVIVLHAQSVCA